MPTKPKSKVKPISQSSNKAGVAVGVGASIVAATAAAYLLFGPEAKKRRRQVRGWAVKMKGEMIEKFEQAKELTEPLYHEIVDQVAERYQKLKTVDEAELAAVVTDIRRHWRTLAKSRVTKKGGQK